ncbi:hypothetical protein EJB05_51480, partial [Eragrostis curvula]
MQLACYSIRTALCRSFAIRKSLGLHRIQVPIRRTLPASDVDAHQPIAAFLLSASRSQSFAPVPTPFAATIPAPPSPGLESERRGRRTASFSIVQNEAYET